jgi:hypothetical protein
MEATLEIIDLLPNGRLAVRMHLGNGLTGDYRLPTYGGVEVLGEPLPTGKAEPAEA